MASVKVSMEGHLNVGSKEAVLASSGTDFPAATLHTGDGNKRKDESRREVGVRKEGLMEILCL